MPQGLFYFPQAVYLCGLMLLEESSSGNDQFSRYAAGLAGTSKGGSILSLLETILQHKRGEEFCYLTQWVVQQLKLVRDSGGRGQQQGQISIPILILYVNNKLLC